jgi:hypothetical protein
MSESKLVLCDLETSNKDQNFQCWDAPNEKWISRGKESQRKLIAIDTILKIQCPGCNYVLFPHDMKRHVFEGTKGGKKCPGIERCPNLKCTAYFTLRAKSIHLDRCRSNWCSQCHRNVTTSLKTHHAQEHSPLCGYCNQKGHSKQQCRTFIECDLCRVLVKRTEWQKHKTKYPSLHGLCSYCLDEQHEGGTAKCSQKFRCLDCNDIIFRTHEDWHQRRKCWPNMFPCEIKFPLGWTDDLTNLVNAYFFEFQICLVNDPNHVESFCSQKVWCRYCDQVHSEKCTFLETCQFCNATFSRQNNLALVWHSMCGIKAPCPLCAIPTLTYELRTGSHESKDCLIAITTCSECNAFKDQRNKVILHQKTDCPEIFVDLECSCRSFLGLIPRKTALQHNCIKTLHQRIEELQINHRDELDRLGERIDTLCRLLEDQGR